MVVFLVQSPAPAADPPGLLRQALRAVEGDSAAALERRAARALARDSLDGAALLILGSVARLTYRYADADTLLARAATLFGHEAWGDYARMEWGASLATRGRLREAADAYALALAGAERRGDTTAMAEALLGLAGPRSRLASPSDAASLLDRAAGLVRGHDALEANLRCQRAALRARGGQREARALADSGAALALRAGDQRQQARCIHVAAQALAATGDMGGAAEALGRAAALFGQSRDHAALAAVLQWRGYLHVLLGHVGTARRLLARAVAEGERAQAMSPVGWALINLGQVSLGVGDRGAAARDLTRAVALLEGQGDEWGMVTALQLLGGVAQADGDVKSAREAYTRALTWADRTGNVVTQFTTHNALASLDAMAGAWQDAGRALDAARAVARAHGMTGWEGSLHYGAGLLALRRGDPALAERELRAYLAVTDTSQRDTRYRARTLIAEAHVMRGAVARAEAEFTAASDELDAWRALLPERDLRMRAFQRADYGADPDLGVATIIAAVARTGRTEAAFALAERRRARELTDGIYRAQVVTVTPPPAAAPRARVFGGSGPRAIAGLVDDSTALLEYVAGRGGEPTTLFIVTAGGTVSRQLAPVDSLAGDVRRFVTLLEGGGDARALGARLGAALLEPAVAALPPGITHLLIVPDDVLARIPFDALVLADGQYALARFAVGVAPSAAAVVAVRARAGGHGAPKLLAFGDPRYVLPRGTDDTTADVGTETYRAAFDAAGGLGRLPASAGEVRRAARHAPGAEVRLRERASEAFLRAAPLDSFRILHFATHALVDERAVTRSALALAPGGGYDGFVGPGDLAELALRADLVVLSACRTAGGELVGGEGLQGLTAPLLQAGARAIVATGWRIADARTGAVLDAFYRELAAGHSVGAALRSAKLDALRGGAPAGEWAAFVVVGDPMTLVPVARPAGGAARRLALLAVAAAMGLALGIYGGIRRKRRAADAT